MKRVFILLGVILLALPTIARGGEEAGNEALGTVKAVHGEVEIGHGGEWRAASVGDELREGMTLRTGPSSGAEVLFAGSIPASVEAEVSIEVSNLLLKARLEKMREKVSEPTDTRKTEMQLTPTTGVRGTDQAEEKAEDLKREHYWNEGEK